MTHYATPEEASTALEHFFELFPIFRDLAKDPDYPDDAVRAALGGFVISTAERMMRKSFPHIPEGNLPFELGILSIFGVEVTNYLPREACLPFIDALEAKCRKYLIVEVATKH